MTPTAENDKRRLVPRWRLLATTLRSKELAQPAKPRPYVFDPLPVELADRLTRWRMSRDLTTAAEVVEAALVTGHESEGIEAARRLLQPDLSARTPIKMQAATLLVRAGFKEEVSEDLRCHRPLDAQTCRALARSNPRDPFAWVDLALHQTVRRHSDAAKRSMAVALNLAPHNRHVLRSAARLYLHDNDPQRAHDLLMRNAATATDPWLMSAEIAMAGIAGRAPRSMKAGTRLMDDRGFGPGQLTELAGALATVHLLDGNRKKSRKMFVTSMLDPTGNALAQGEWAAMMQLGDIVPMERLHAVYDAHEAEALHHYRQARFESVTPFCLKWADADPFSIRPYELGALAANNAGMYETAIHLARKGLEFRSHPFKLRQSLVFSLASSGHLDKAEIEIAIMRDGGDEVMKAMITANKGLIAFRRGNLEEGRSAYRSALDGLRRTGKAYLAASASYYFARESRLAAAPDASERLAEATKLISPFKHTEIGVLLKRLIDPEAAAEISRDADPSEIGVKSEQLRQVRWSIKGLDGAPRRVIQ